LRKSSNDTTPNKASESLANGSSTARSRLLKSRDTSQLLAKYTKETPSNEDTRTGDSGLKDSAIQKRILELRSTLNDLKFTEKMKKEEETVKEVPFKTEIRIEPVDTPLVKVPMIAPAAEPTVLPMVHDLPNLPLENDMARRETKEIEPPETKERSEPVSRKITEPAVTRTMELQDRSFISFDSSKNVISTEPRLEKDSFHRQVLQNLIDDALESFRMQLRTDILNMHVDMMKQMYEQKVFFYS
jgi:hypothetical protein